MMTSSEIVPATSQPAQTDLAVTDEASSGEPVGSHLTLVTNDAAADDSESTETDDADQAETTDDTTVGVSKTGTGDISVDVSTWKPSRTSFANRMLFVLTITTLVTWQASTKLHDMLGRPLDTLRRVPSQIHRALDWMHDKIVAAYGVYRDLKDDPFMNENTLACYVIKSSISLFVPIVIAGVYSYVPSSILRYTLISLLAGSAMIFVFVTYTFLRKPVTDMSIAAYHFAKNYSTAKLKSSATRLIGTALILASSWLLTSS